MDNASTSFRDVKLPASLCEAAERHLQGTPFATLEELLTFVLRELTSPGGSAREEQERQIIEQRLRDLGYL